MTEVRLNDISGYVFDQEKYRIIFEGVRVLFILKREIPTCRNRPDKMVLDYHNMTFREAYPDGYEQTRPFLGVI
jgi:hypothetical protein